MSQSSDRVVEMVAKMEAMIDGLDEHESKRRLKVATLSLLIAQIDGKITHHKTWSWILGPSLYEGFNRLIN